MPDEWVGACPSGPATSASSRVGEVSSSSYSYSEYSEDNSQSDSDQSVFKGATSKTKAKPPAGYVVKNTFLEKAKVSANDL